MPQFLQKQVYPREEKAFTLGGVPITFDINRDSLLRGLLLRIKCTVTTGIATPSADGIKALFQNVLLKGTLDGRPINPINNVRLASLIELLQIQFRKQCQIPTVPAAGYIELDVPIDFLSPTFAGEAQFYTCLPTTRMSDLTLTLTPGTQAQVDANAAPTFEGTFSVEVIQNQFFRNTLPLLQGNDPLPFLATEIGENVFDSGTDFSTGKNEFKLPAGGFYTHLLSRAYTDAENKQSPTGATANSSPYDTGSGKQIILYDANRQIRQQGDLYTFRAFNHQQIFDTLPDGNFAFNFADEGANGLFNTDLIATGESNVIIEADTRTNDDAQIIYTRRRLYDPQNVLNLL